MSNPTHDPPVVMPASPGVDRGKQGLNRRPGFVIKQVCIGHVRSVHPTNLAGLDQKILAIPSA
jgi:hypothetical protein